MRPLAMLLLAAACSGDGMRRDGSGGGGLGGQGGGVGGGVGGGGAGGGGVGGSGVSGGGTVTGTVRGKASFPVMSAYWIGTPDPGSPPTSVSSPVSVYVLEPGLTCSDISQVLWDKPLGAKQVLELNFSEVSAKAYTVNQDVIANYLSGSYNPEASGGAVTVTSVAAGGRIAGTFDLAFPGGDALKGTFDAPYCATGMEP